MESANKKRKIDEMSGGDVVSSIDRIFDSFSKSIEEELEAKEQIKKYVKLIDSGLRHATVFVQQIHSNHKSGTTRAAALQFDGQQVLAKLDTIFPEWKANFAELQKLVTGENYYKYIGIWKNQIQQIVFVASMYRYLEREELISIRDVEEILGLPGKKPDAPCAWAVELEDYLLGISFLPSELSRYCVVAVIAEDYSIPPKISKFVTELFAGFRLLNLKNDFLRKRFDSIKYDVKKIEEVLYDIKIRRLGQTVPTSE